MFRSSHKTTGAATFVLIIALLTFAARPSARQSDWRIRGHITDRGQPVTNVTVVVTNLETGEERRAMTNSNGFFDLRKMPVGRYKIRVIVGRYAVKEITEVRIGPNLPDRFDIDLAKPFKPPVPVPTKTVIIPRIKSPTPAVTTTPAETGSPPPIQAPSPSPTQFSSEIEKILKNLPVGNIAFNTPEKMELDETSEIMVALSAIKTTEEIKKEIKETGIVETAQIKISDFMEADLQGPGFKITPITLKRQFVSKNEDTFWKWNITAIKPGKQSLNLTLNVFLEEKGREFPRSLPSFSREIDIEVSISTRVAGFIEKNWQWLWAVLVVPIAGWLWRRFSLKKNKPESE